MGKSSAKEWPKKAFVVAMATLSLCSCRQPDVGDVYITRRNLSVSSNEGECTIGRNNFFYITGKGEDTYVVIGEDDTYCNGVIRKASLRRTSRSTRLRITDGEIKLR